MPHPTDWNLEELFPNLAASGWRKLSEPAQYNCIAFALHDTQQWWEYLPGFHGYYWPPGIKRDDTTESWIKVYEMHGFKVCDNSVLEDGVEKIAIYVKDDEPQHVARQLGSGIWASKIGEYEDIAHDTLGALAGDSYGMVEIIMKRPRIRTVIQ